MAQSVLPGYMESRVANREPSTVMSLVPGFVTIGPTPIRSVRARICEKMTNGSGHRTWESKSQHWSNPWPSAMTASSTTREIGGSGWRTTPKDIGSEALIKGG